MTDNEVIKELQCAAEWFKEHGRNTNTAIIGICDRAVDLINRQIAENTELQRKNAELQYEKVKLINEAIKEFAERMKLRFRNTVSCNYGAIHEAVNRIVKEMTEDEEK